MEYKSHLSSPPNSHRNPIEYLPLPKIYYYYYKLLFNGNIMSFILLARGREMINLLFDIGVLFFKNFFRYNKFPCQNNFHYFLFSTPSRNLSLLALQSMKIPPSFFTKTTLFFFRKFFVSLRLPKYNVSWKKFKSIVGR